MSYTNREPTQEEIKTYWIDGTKQVSSSIHYLSLELTPDHPAIEPLKDAYQSIMKAKELIIETSID